LLIYSHAFQLSPKIFLLILRSSTFQKIFLLQSFLSLSIKNVKNLIKILITSGFTSASAFYSSQKISKHSTLSQVDITDSISDDYSNKSNTCQSSINISNIVSSPQVLYLKKAVVFNTEKSTQIYNKCNN